VVTASAHFPDSGDVKRWKDFLWGPQVSGGQRLEVLVRSFERGRIDRDVLPALLPEVWRHADAPLLAFPPSKLVALFRSAGFLSDDPAVAAPLSALTVYRGCHPAVQFGLSWSTCRAAAVTFRDGLAESQFLRALYTGAIKRPSAVGRPDVCKLYTAAAPPESILAVLRDRGEQQIVVDPSLLTSVHEL
jgi:hypothetical protein